MNRDVPRLPLPDERAVMWLHEDREVRLLSELLLAVLCIPAGMAFVALLRGGAYDPDGTTLLTTALGLAPLVALASLRRPSDYLLTTTASQRSSRGGFCGLCGMSRSPVFAASARRYTCVAGARPRMRSKTSAMPYG